MKKLVYFKTWSTNPNAKTFDRPICVHSYYKSELEELFKEYNHRIDFRPFEDGKSIVIDNSDYNSFYSDVWFDILTLMKNNGFTFTNKVKEFYEFVKCYWEKRQERIKNDIERKKIKEQEKEQAKQINNQGAEYGLLCPKYDCITTREFCKNECKRYIQLNGYCRPWRVKIIRG